MVVAILALAAFAVFVASSGGVHGMPGGGKSAKGQPNQTAQGDQSAPVPDSGGLDPQTLSERANQVMRLKASRVIKMNVPSVPDVSLTTAIDLDGHAYTLNLQPHSVRAPNYQLQAQVADGSLVQVEPGPSRMLRGSLAEVPGSEVAGGLLDDGLHAVIRMPDGRAIWTEPLVDRVPGAAPDDYVTYHGEDAMHPDGTCGVDNDFIAAHPGPVIPQGNGPDGAAGPDGSIIWCTELACDADVEYYNFYGANVTTVQNRINLVINTMNIQYINQVDIQHVITNIIVRTAEPDPYSATAAGTLLGQLQTQWNNNHGSIPRDVVQLFTAKNIDGTTIGIAILGTICNLGSAYSLVQSDCCGGLSCATDLSAHELGHSWNASHCSASCSSTMNPSIMCVNTFLNSNPNSVTSIVNFRNTRTCLSQCADATLPFVDDFPSTTLDPAKWTTIVGVTSNTLGTNEPTAPNSMNLKGTTAGGTQIRSSRINATGLVNFQMSYKHERTGGGNQPEAGDDLVVEYFNNLGNWVEISRQLGSGAAQSTYTTVTVNFPADALHSEFRVRFRNLSTQNNLDDWFVDDVNITGVIPPSNNICVNALVAQTSANSVTTLGASTDGPDEPVGCGFAAPTQIGNDVWYKWLAPCTGAATFSLCGASFDARMAVYIGCPSGSGQSIACSDNFCGSSPQVTFNATQSTLYRIRIGGFNNATGTGTLNISCIPSNPPCPADVNNSGSVDIDDLLIVINSFGPCAGCPGDVNNTGTVDIDDMLFVINNWGACP